MFFLISTLSNSSIVIFWWKDVKIIGENGEKWAKHEGFWTTMAASSGLVIQVGRGAVADAVRVGLHQQRNQQDSGRLIEFHGSQMISVTNSSTQLTSINTQHYKTI